MPKFKTLTITIVALISIVSLIYSYSFHIQTLFTQMGIPTWGQTSEVSYYSTFGRLWQITAGGIVFLLPLHRSKLVNASLAALGLALIVLAGCSNISLAPYSVIITVIATILLIRYTPNTPVNSILDAKWLQWIGRISFSLYLIHFPLIVIYKRWEKLYPDLFSGFIIALAALAIGWLLWFGIEKRKLKLSAVCTLFALTMSTAFCFRYMNKLDLTANGWSITYPHYNIPKNDFSDSVTHHFNTSLLLANDGTESLMLNQTSKNPEKLLPLNNGGSPEFIFVGDSNAQHLYSGFNELSKIKGFRGAHLTAIVVPLENRFIQLSDPSYNWSEAKAAALYTWLSKHDEIHTVIISQLWSSRLYKQPALTWNKLSITPEFAENTAELKRFCSKLKQMNKQVVLVMPSPRFFNFDKELHGTGLEYARWLERRHDHNFDINNPDEPFVLTEAKYREYYKQVIDLFDSWEKEGFCSVLHIEKPMFQDGNYLGLKNGVLYCKDATHITPPAAIELMEGVADEFQQIIIKGRTLSEQKKRE